MRDLLDVVVPAIFHPRSGAGQGKRCQQGFHRPSTALSPTLIAVSGEGAGLRAILGGKVLSATRCSSWCAPSRTLAKETRYMRTARVLAILALWMLAQAPATHAQAP